MKPIKQCLYKTRNYILKLFNQNEVTRKDAVIEECVKL